MYKIAVNAGHMPGNDDFDHGAVGAYSQEGDITKKVAHVVCDDLRNVGYDVIFIQEDELGDICEIANSFGADAFVSIHCNSASATAHGTETWYHEGSTKGMKLAGFIQNQLVDAMNTTDRGVKVDTDRYASGFAVLRDTNMPAALPELAFISNPDEEDYMNNNIEVMAHAVARGITDYFANH